ncbi:Hypothetical protein CINCED_3A007792 [Cinara cedri]|uniref:Uncharacterized protein n=1 Tax=Cinara cedri TaxID=506608 RepID=A0A5E4NNN7_9HEMI|nr:Hypothetical protein CINCED_3A007792 [Cinara cedri]
MPFKFIARYVIIYSFMSVLVHGDESDPDMPPQDIPDPPPFANNPGNPSTSNHNGNRPSNPPSDDCLPLGCCPLPCKRDLKWAQNHCKNGIHDYSPYVIDCVCCN